MSAQVPEVLTGGRVGDGTAAGPQGHGIEALRPRAVHGVRSEGTANSDAPLLVDAGEPELGLPPPEATNVHSSKGGKIDALGSV
jgi:hypothetical protein